MTTEPMSAGPSRPPDEIERELDELGKIYPAIASMLGKLRADFAARRQAAASHRAQAGEPRQARQREIPIMPGTNLNLSDLGRLPAASSLDVGDDNDR